MIEMGAALYTNIISTAKTELDLELLRLNDFKLFHERRSIQQHYPREFPAQYIATQHTSTVSAFTKAYAYFIYLQATLHSRSDNAILWHSASTTSISIYLAWHWQWEA